MGLGMALGGLLTLVVIGCEAADDQLTRGSGTLVTVSHDLAGFDAVEARRGFEIRVTPGDTFVVTVVADDDVAESLEVALEGSVLHLDVDEAVNLADATARAEVSMPTLRGLTLVGGAVADVEGFADSASLEASLSGGSRFTCADLRLTGFALDLSGGSSVACADVDAESLQATLDEGSRVTMGGAAATADIASGGAGSLELEDLAVAAARVTLAEGSQAAMRVSGTLDAELRAGSRLVYEGDPVLGLIDVDAGSTLAPAATPQP
jgi:hypothetical protein